MTAARPVKCVVWDLDGTIWNGTLLEDPTVALRPGIVDLIRRLDEVGILHSIASKNDPDLALARLEALDIAEYFLFPQVGWSPKSASVKAIASALNLGLDALAFVDDQPFELAEVAHGVPEVRCIHVDDIVAAAAGPEFRPPFVTDESRQRRLLYRAGAARDQAEEDFAGTSDEFLATLAMRLRIVEATPADLQRAEELTVRTNQLNSTGRTYSYDELAALCASPDHLLLVAGLDDRFGSYGTVGLSVVEKGDPSWHLRLLLMSCRVVSRGVGSVLLHHVMRLARAAGADLRADFVATGRNRMMYVAYAFAGFEVVEKDGDRSVLRSSLATIQPPPPYLDLVTR